MTGRPWLCSDVINNLKDARTQPMAAGSAHCGTPNSKVRRKL